MVKRMESYNRRYDYVNYLLKNESVPFLIKELIFLINRLLKIFLAFLYK